jgi:outer membrane protein assembly factor BamA
MILTIMGGIKHHRRHLSGWTRNLHHRLILALGIVLTSLLSTGIAVASTSAPDSSTGKATDILPMVSYDSNTGFGTGVKSFFLNHIGWNESIDAVAFISTEGERWFRVVGSLPDFERREGTVYPVALDLVADYDIQTSYSFFGVGNRSTYDDRIYYKREALDLSATLSRGFSPTFVGQAGIRHRSVKNSGYPTASPLGLYSAVPDEFEFGRTTVQSVVRWDSRNSFINASEGCVLQIEGEKSLSGSGPSDFFRMGGWLQYYTPLFSSRIVLACRGGIQNLQCDDPPVQILLPIGGAATVRGYAQDRYLDKASAVVNIEARFPVWGRFSGMAGFDAGKVWHEVKEMDFSRWARNPVVGIRYGFDTFITRLDVGFGPEETALYLNFGQLF